MTEKIENLNKELSLTFKRLSKYSNQEINFKPNSKKWSMGENMYHLWLTEITTEKYIRKKTSYPDTLVNVSKIAKLRLKLLKLIFFLGLKFKAPKIVVDPIPENIDLQELKNKWLKSRDSFEILINNNIVNTNNINNAPLDLRLPCPCPPVCQAPGPCGRNARTRRQLR